VSHEVGAVEIGRRRWETRLTGYLYHVLADDVSPIVMYHWHRCGASWVTWPHLHAGGLAGGIELKAAHMPTHRVSLEEFLTMILEARWAEQMRSDWQTVLRVGERGR
jgi:hypothetical protein